MLAGRGGAHALGRLEELCELMLQGSLCGLGGMTPFPVQSALKHFRDDFGAQAQH
ncbi:MAG: NADH-ubiquinone oxidoreductase-F iron-sulfur binding region domain-containing protein [Steroidobacteraceae bacterium]